MKRGFTLAEVLITLTIIGVIAVLTIPNLMQQWQDHSEMTAVKKAYSVIDNAIKMAIAENGPMDEWGWPVNDDTEYSTENGLFFAEQIKPYLKVQKFCGTNVHAGCSITNQKALNGQAIPSSHFSFGISGAQRMILADGTHIAIGTLTIKHHYGIKKIPSMYDSTILVDTNGKKGPNRVGYDIFGFGLSYSGLVPSSCAFDSRDTDGTGCTITEQKAYNGCSCYYWILKHKNMDYKYRDVSSEW